ETAHRNMQGAEEVRWLDRLEAEHDNLRQVLLWSQEEPEQTEHGLRLCAALTLFWQTRGHLTEGRFWCDRLLKAGGTPGRPRARGYALLGAGSLALGQGDFAAAQTMAEESLEIFRQSEERSGIGEALRLLGDVARHRSDDTLALKCLEESLAIQHETGNQPG